MHRARLKFWDKSGKLVGKRSVLKCLALKLPTVSGIRPRYDYRQLVLSAIDWCEIRTTKNTERGWGEKYSARCFALLLDVVKQSNAASITKVMELQLNTWLEPNTSRN